MTERMVPDDSVTGGYRLDVNNERLAPAAPAIIFVGDDSTTFPTVLDALTGFDCTVKQYNLKPIEGVELGGCGSSVLRLIQIVEGDRRVTLIPVDTIERVEIY